MKRIFKVFAASILIFSMFSSSIVHAQEPEPIKVDVLTYLVLKAVADQLGSLESIADINDLNISIVLNTVPSIAGRPTGGPTTLDVLLAAIEGETNAWAHYMVYAEVAENEGFPEIARVFRATGNAELQHADDQWEIAQTLGATVRPQAGAVTSGTTAENLQSGIDGETYEFAIMYPDFYHQAIVDGNVSARRIFNFALRAEAVHSVNYQRLLDVLNGDGDFSAFEYVYRCPVCGDIQFERPENCVICRTPGAQYISYNEED